MTLALAGTIAKASLAISFYQLGDGSTLKSERFILRS